MGCCCLNHKDTAIYYTAARIGASSGNSFIYYDALRPWIGDQSAFVPGQPSSIYVANGFLYNAVTFNAGAFDALDGNNWIVVTCWDIDSNSVVWSSHVDSTCTGLRIYADSSYVWVGTDDGEGFSFYASSGTVIEEVTGLSSLGYLYMTAGVAENSVQYGPLAEYNHLFSNTQVSLITHDFVKAWDIGSYYVAWYSPSRVYSVPKALLSSETLLASFDSGTNILGASDSVFFADDVFTSNQFDAYDYDANLLWGVGDSDARNYISYYGSYIYCTTSVGRLLKIDPTDGSTIWEQTFFFVSTSAQEPRKSLIDTSNNQLAMVSSFVIRPRDLSDGDVNWTNGVSAQDLQLVDNWLYASSTRVSVPT